MWVGCWVVGGVLEGEGGGWVGCGVVYVVYVVPLVWMVWMVW